MKPFARQAGGNADKLSTQDHAGRYQQRETSKTSTRDKTQHCSARPGAKDKIRKARIALKKRTRQRLKLEDQDVVSEALSNPLGLTGEHDVVIEAINQHVAGE